MIGLRSDGKNFPSINRPALDNCYMLENTINREVVICSNYQQYCKTKDVKKADVNVWKVMPFRFISQDFAMSETFLFGEGAILDTSLLMEVESSEERSAMTADVSVDQALPMPLEYSDYGCKLAVDVVRIFECGIIPGSAVPSVISQAHVRGVAGVYQVGVHGRIRTGQVLCRHSVNFTFLYICII